MSSPNFYVNWDDIRAAARTVTRDSDEWLSDLAPASASAPPSFGKDALAQIATVFHSRTHTRSMDYYREVGEAAGDVGLGLSKMANLYEAVDKNAVDKAAAVAAGLWLGAEVGLL